MAQALFARLHAATPGLQLDALAPRWVAPVLERMPRISQIIDNPFAHGELALSARFALARRTARGVSMRLCPAQFAQVGTDPGACRDSDIMRLYRRIATA